METADDPRGEWTPASDIVVAAGADTRTKTLSIPIDDKQKFARTKVRRRP